MPRARRRRRAATTTGRAPGRRQHQRRRARRPARRRAGAEAGRGQVERDRLAGDEVVGGERRELRDGHRGEHRRAARGPRRLRARAPRGVGAARGADPAPAARPGPRATSSSSATSRSPPTCRWSAPPRPTPPCRAPLARCWPGPATGRSAPASAPGAASRRFFVDRFPAALYRAALVVAGTAAGATSWSRAVMMWWLLDHPDVEQTLLSPDAGRPAGRTTTSRATTASTPPATSPPRSGSTTPGWPRCAWPSASSALPVVYLLFQNVANLAIIGSIMIRHGRGGQFWGLILPHGLLELTAVFVAGGVGLRLFWSWVEPGRPDPGAVARPGGPHRRHGRARPGRGAARQRADRGAS